MTTVLAFLLLTSSFLINACTSIRNRNLVDIRIQPQKGFEQGARERDEQHAQAQGHLLAGVVGKVVTQHGFLDDTRATLEAIKHGGSISGDFRFFAVFVKAEGQGSKQGRNLLITCNVYYNIVDHVFVVAFEENRQTRHTSEFLRAIVTETEKALNDAIPGITYRIAKSSEPASILDP